MRWLRFGSLLFLTSPPLLVVGGCARAPSAAKATATASSCDPATSFVEIVDGATTSRFTAGRMLTPTRGSTASFAELVRHPDGATVFSLEGIAAGGAQAGHIAVSVNPFEAEHAQSAPGSVHAEYMRSGSASERDELTTTDGAVSFTSFGEVGQIVEGTLGPVSARSTAGATTTLTVRFHVCRTADWIVSR